MLGRSSDRMADTEITERRLLLRMGVILLTLLHPAAGKLEIRRTDSPIQAPPGYNTTLPCLFYGYEASPLDLSIVSVLWTLRTLKGDERVYWFHAGRHTQYRPRSHIPDSGLIGGDGSLYIPNIQPSDEGEYTCTVYVTPEKAIRKVTMEVSAVPTCTVSDSRLEMHPDTERSVTCYVSGFYPQPVTIRWVKNSKSSTNKANLDNWTYTSIPVQSPDGMYSMKSLLPVRPMSTEEDGDVYSCVITHRSLRDPLTCNIVLLVQSVPEDNNARVTGIVLGILVTLPLLSVVLFLIYKRYIKKAPPEVLDITAPDLIHGKKTTLTCPILNYRPRDIEINLYLKKDNEETLVASWPTRHTGSDEENLLLPDPLILDPVISPPIHGVSSCTCYIHITPDIQEHNGAKLILEVHHEALEAPIRKELRLRVTAPPEVLDITGPELIHRKRTILTCHIVNFSPLKIPVLFYLKKDNEKTILDSRSTIRTENLRKDPLLKPPLMMDLFLSSFINGVFSCFCVISITPDVQEHNGAKLILEVHHEALKSPIHKELRLRVTASPVLDPIVANKKSYNVGDHVELTCRIHSFHPRYINVIWYKNGETLPSTNTEVEEDNDRLFSITSSVRATVIEKDYGKIFRCKVNHPGRPEKDEEVTWTLQRPGD